MSITLYLRDEHFVLYKSVRKCDLPLPMLRHKCDDGLRVVVDRRQNIDQAEKGQKQPLVSTEVAAMCQQLFDVHLFFQMIIYTKVLL